MNPFATLKPLAATLGALLLFAGLGIGQATAQDGTTLSIQSQEAQSGESVDVPVEVTDFNDVGSVSLTINYDPAVLSFPDGADTDQLISGAPRDGFTANVPESGTLKISWFDGTGQNPINIDDGELLTIAFGNYAGGTSEVTFDGESEITDIEAQTIDATYSDGVVAENLSALSVGSVEQASLNQTVSVPLSGENLQNVGSVSLEVDFDPSVVEFEGLANDNSGLDLQASATDGVVTIGGFNADGTALDSNFVELEFNFLGGSTTTRFGTSSEVTDPEDNELPVSYSAGTLAGDEPTVSISDRGVVAGATISVPVEASELQDVGSASVDVNYNPAVLTFDGPENGIEGFNLQVNSPETGVVRIAGFSSEGVDPSQNSDRFVDLQFTVDPGLTVGDQTTVSFDTENSELTNPNSVQYNTTFDDGLLEVIPEEPEDITVDVSRSFENASDPSNYRLVAVPGSVDVEVAQTISGNVGTEWRAFLELGSSGGDADASLQDYADEAFNFTPGRGVWVIGKNEWSFEGTVPAVHSADGTPSIGLQGGWNAVSNPLRSDLSWSAVRQASGLDQPLWRWNGSWQEVDTLRSATTGEAYYVFNGAGVDSLELASDLSASQTLTASSEQQAGGDESARTIDLSAKTEEVDVSSTVTVGVDRDADKASKHRAPPAHFGGTALRIKEGDPAKNYMQLVAATDENVREFDLSLQGEPGAEVEISASDLPQDASSDFGVVLVDGETTHDLRTGGATVTVDEEGGSTDLKVQVGSAEEIAEKTTPENTRLRANYPNPFSRKTTIEYTVAEQSEVTVRVFNLLGQQVATLAQGTKQAGTHRIDWESQNLSSGKYFVRLEAGGMTDTKQITVVR